MNKTKAEENRAYLWFICFVAACGGLLFGYDAVVVSGIVPQVSAAILFASAVWSALSGTAGQLIGARLLGGVGAGMATLVCPLYISEVSPEQQRGRMVTLYHFTVCLGIVLCVFANWGIFSLASMHAGSGNTSGFWMWFAVDQNWRAMFAAEAIPGLLFLICSLLIPESPRWLIKKGRLQEGERVLSKLNGTKKAREVCREIRDTVQAEQQVAFLDLAALLLLVRWLMPETKGRSIESIERSWLTTPSSVGGRTQE